eukprot:SM002837S10772  [mRNA]  locus=s2837:890:1183:- [translate_table: standard]
MDIYRGYGVKWSSLIQHLARLVDARRRRRALSQASGFRGGAPAAQVSLSDLFVLTRGY